MRRLLDEYVGTPKLDATATNTTSAVASEKKP
jgi:hypothetical protein